MPMLCRMYGIADRRFGQVSEAQSGSAVRSGEDLSETAKLRRRKITRLKEHWHKSKRRGVEC
jgi:hypothetical protein